MNRRKEAMAQIRSPTVVCRMAVFLLYPLVASIYFFLLRLLQF